MFSTFFMILGADVEILLSSFPIAPEGRSTKKNPDFFSSDFAQKHVAMRSGINFGGKKLKNFRVFFFDFSTFFMILGADMKFS